MLGPRLACLIHAASVHPELGSNSFRKVQRDKRKHSFPHFFSTSNLHNFWFFVTHYIVFCFLNKKRLFKDRVPSSDIEMNVIAIIHGGNSRSRGKIRLNHVKSARQRRSFGSTVHKLWTRWVEIRKTTSRRGRFKRKVLLFRTTGLPLFDRDE